MSTEPQADVTCINGDKYLKDVKNNSMTNNKLYDKVKEVMDEVGHAAGEDGFTLVYGGKEIPRNNDKVRILTEDEFKSTGSTGNPFTIATIPHGSGGRAQSQPADEGLKYITPLPKPGEIPFLDDGDPVDFLETRKAASEARAAEKKAAAAAAAKKAAAAEAAAAAKKADDEYMVANYTGERHFGGGRKRKSKRKSRKSKKRKTKKRKSKSRRRRRRSR
jgi:hypothetical protein